MQSAELAESFVAVAAALTTSGRFRARGRTLDESVPRRTRRSDGSPDVLDARTGLSSNLGQAALELGGMVL